MSKKIYDPHESGSVTHGDNTIYVSPIFTPASSKNGDHPLRIFDEKFSRVKVSIVKAGEGGADANIPARDIMPVLVDSISCNHAEVQRMMMSGPEEEETSPAYTVRFTNGTLKGKTPAEVLDEQGDAGKGTLNAQWQWLSKNTAKYPRNREQMAAIEEAARLYSAGELKKIRSPKPFILYDVPVKGSPYKTRSDGLGFCYSIRLAWMPGTGVDARISNFYAPVVRTPDGKVNVRADQKDESSAKTYSFLMSRREWLYLLMSIPAVTDAFTAMYGPGCLRDADSLERAERAAHKEKEHGTE